MSQRPSENTELHTRILRVTLEVDNAREYWRREGNDHEERVTKAFNEYWFGARSMARVNALLKNFDLRFANYPDALAALRAWPNIKREARVAICHWHLQLADPLYRAFVGDYCPARREGGRPLTRDAVVRWVRSRDPMDHWSAATQIQFASKLLSSAHAAGLLARNKDPRPLTTPRVTSGALGYLLHALRGIDFAGSLHDNPYLRSVGIVGGILDDRVRRLPGISMRRVADLVEFSFEHDSPLAWVRATQTEHAA